MTPSDRNKKVRGFPAPPGLESCREDILMAGPLPLLVTVSILALVGLYPEEAASLASCLILVWIWRVTE